MELSEHLPSMAQVQTRHVLLYSVLQPLKGAFSPLLSLHPQNESVAVVAETALDCGCGDTTQRVSVCHTEPPGQEVNQARPPLQPSSHQGCPKAGI